MIIQLPGMHAVTMMSLNILILYAQELPIAIEGHDAYYTHSVHTTSHI